MKILLHTKLPGDWKQSALKLGHELYYIDENRIVESFDRVKPDVVILDSKNCNKDYNYALNKYKNCQIVLIGEIKENCIEHRYIFKISGPERGYFTKDFDFDLLPYSTIEQEGRFDKKFECDIAIVGFEQKDLKEINKICNDYKNVKIFGKGNCDNWQYVGHVPLNEISSIYRSAKNIVSFKNDWLECMNVITSGGIFVNKNKYKYPAYCFENINFNYTQDFSKELLEKHTLTNRLRDMLNLLN